MAVKWVNRQTPLYSDPRVKAKICDVPPRSVVQTTGATTGTYEEVRYPIKAGKMYGWIHMNDLEDYVRNYRINAVKIDDQTPDETDFEQYWLYDGVRQVNWCGELCVCDILGISSAQLMSVWTQKNPSFLRRLFSKPVARGTGAEELLEILALFDRKGVVLARSLYEEHINRARYTQKGLMDLLKRGSVIVSVKINPGSGLIDTSGVLHWVRLLGISPERNGHGSVLVYNPAMNCDEEYSWDLFAQSIGSAPYGIYSPNPLGL